MFKQIENEYRPIPFWSWNERLNTEETKRQIAMMGNVGMGGFFMHARGGLQTEYMGTEWFDNVEASIKSAKERGMYAWAYDENGWPSGFGNGIVNSMGIEFQQKYLRFEEGEKQTDTTICNRDGIHFYYDINPFYVDTLNGKATQMFVEKIYQPYYDKFQNEIEGFFTDEPQISRNGIPWSFLLPEEYKKSYNENLTEHLIELFRPLGDYKKTRLQFWKLVTELFSKNFMKPIYDWCSGHNVKLIGHLVLEEDLKSQLVSNGACMPHYEYFHVPGMDWLGRPIFRCLTALQLTSVAHQLGKNRILSETFGLCGHNVGHDELKGILEWQMVYGITQLCQHLEGYSLRGIRKRDYPPAMSYQQPWWDDSKLFNESMSRIGKILATGEVKYDTLLIHPQSSAWVCFDNDKNEGLDKLTQSLFDTMQCLEEKHILYHFGDEIIMQRHARVEDGSLVIGSQKYTTVVLPPYEVLLDTTKELLAEFEAQGGKIITADQAENNPIINVPHINYTKRCFSDFDIYYFVNSTEESYDAEIAVGSQLMDIKTGNLLPFDGKHKFAPYESLVVVDNHTMRKESLPDEELKPLDLGGEWQIKAASPNALSIDRCDYYFDGKLIEKYGYVLNIQERACSLKRPINIRCDYKFDAKYIPDKLYLACETPDIFDISVNGKKIEKSECGYFIDTAFKKLDITPYVQIGKNTVTFDVLYRQSDSLYQNLENAQKFESERNKLTYDMEIEPIYIVGDFAVECNGSFEALDKNASRFTGDFALSKPAKTLNLSNIEKQGYPFFAGSITLQKEFELTDTNCRIDFAKKGVNVIKIKANDCDEHIFMWAPFECDISSQLKHGKNKIEITLINNLRNLMGPHHLEEGESYFVGPWSFFKEPCIWNGYNTMPWNDGYCFVEFGIEANL